MARGDLIIVWGNCQAAPLADLLRAPLGRAGYRILDVEPVYLIGTAELTRIVALLPRCAAFVAQPVREAAYRGGRGSDTLIAQLPATAAVVQLPVTFDTSGFPFQAHGHGADGVRVDAPVTEYHDLRAALAAHRGLTPAQTTAWWPAPTADGVRRRAAASRAELRRREHGLDIATSDLVGHPAALWTMTHPTNALLGRAADRILTQLRQRGIATDTTDVAVRAPEREYLGARRTPIEPAVADALGWDAATVRPDWQVEGHRVPLVELLAAQLPFYAQRPDVVEDLLHRHGDRLTELGIDV